LEFAPADNWGAYLAALTGSAAHLRKLGAFRRIQAPEEEDLYRKLKLQFIPPELREGRDEIEQARQGTLPALVSLASIRGELHAHSTSSDGSNSIEQMAAAAKARGYEYIGITDHSQSLRIARGVSTDDLRKQVRFIDKLNQKLNGIRVLKSSEVDILADGSLDYPDDILRELDYTVCSIHSRFALGKAEQTERIMRAMDNPHFTILGHATGRLILKRPGYEIDIERLARHAKETGRAFEINSSPDRLDLSAENARIVREAGVRIAITTDAHSTRELGLIRYGLGQARRAGFSSDQVLNCQSWDRHSHT
jgi:DNA polymerase (family 10)